MPKVEMVMASRKSALGIIVEKRKKKKKEKEKMRKTIIGM